MDFLSNARQNMVDNQVKAAGVMNPSLLAAMRKIPREKFVPKPYIDAAYTDFDIPLADSRFLFRPAVIGRFIEAANLCSEDFVADVGCKLGYITAIAAEMSMAVVGIENDKALVKAAEQNLPEVDNAAIVLAKLEKGLPNQAPFDVILLEEIQPSPNPPEQFIAQLADNGRMLFITGKAPVLTAHILTKSGNETKETFAYDFLLNPFAEIVLKNDLKCKP